MKIELYKIYEHWRFIASEVNYKQEQFDYAFKYLNFDKLYKDWFIFFNNKETEDWFYKTYIAEDWLNTIYKKSPEGYKWLKNNWSNGIFRAIVTYCDKQELKTIVNRVINVELIRGEIDEGER